MKAKKENKIYTIGNEQEKQRYLKAGYDIYDDEGRLVEYSPQKRIGYSQYAALVKEAEALRTENIRLTEEAEALRTENSRLTEEAEAFRQQMPSKEAGKATKQEAGKTAGGKAGG